MQLEIKHIQKQIGITISVTHDQEEALTMSDRVCVMNHGRIEQISTPGEIYQKPKNKFVAEFIGEINIASRHSKGVEAQFDKNNWELCEDTMKTEFSHRFSKNDTIRLQPLNGDVWKSQVFSTKIRPYFEMFFCN